MSENSASSGSKLAAVVLAGGLGTRIRHLLPGIPKPMAQVAGRPFIDHVLRHLAAQGVQSAVLSTGHLSEVIERYFAPGRLPGLTVSCIREDEPRGTAGGFLLAARTSGLHPNVWLVANGDSLVYADLRSFLSSFAAGGWDAAVLGLQVVDAARFGTLETDAHGQLRRFAEKRPGAATINAGVYLFRAGLLEAFPAKSPLSFETEVFPALLAAGWRILVHPVAAPFLDIGTPESLAQAGEFIAIHGGKDSTEWISSLSASYGQFLR